MALDVRSMLGTHDVLMITLDTLRYDVALAAAEAGETPVLTKAMGGQPWEKRHTPGTFTYAAHHAFLAGFLPTPARPGRHPRLFAAAFAGSETTVETTAVFEAPTIVAGFRGAGYRTVCIGGVGFFNPATPLGRVLPGLFDEAHWSRALGVTDPRSTEHQVNLARERLAAFPVPRRVFLFINVSALHQPNRFYLAGAQEDGIDTHRAALRYVDGALAPLFEAFRARGPTLALIMSDHGTAYGEDGYYGHRLSHPSVLDVPFAAFVIDPGRDPAR